MIKSSKPAMTRMSTRSSARLSHIPQKNYTPKEETKETSRVRNRRRITSNSESDNETILRTPRKDCRLSSDYEWNQVAVTPPKQKKITGEEHLQTPQHKNEIKEDIIKTPSSLFINLTLTSPPPKSTQKYKAASSNRKNLFRDPSREEINRTVDESLEKEGSKNRKQLFFEDNGNISSENILQEQNNKVKRTISVYQNARRALHGAFPTDMPGREKELNDLREFIKQHLTNKSSGSLYVSGPPGTGKTASLNKILEEDDISSHLRKVYVNCTSIKSPMAIYSRIAKELGIKMNGKADYLVGLENHLKKQNKMILLVLDEIDQLESKNQSVLYTIFEWPSKPNSHLILVGIANALDLTDRILPRLQARCELKPKLMHFAPYTKQQIVQIITSRLKTADVLQVFSPAAIQMLAGKVAAVSGDVRRALDIGRRVVELVDQSKEEDVLKSTENLANGLLDKEKAVENIPKTVDLKQVINILNNVYGTSQNLTEEAEDTFPLQQKIIICSLLLMLKKAKNKDVTVGRLHEVYKRVCTKRNLLAVDQAEFVGLCSLIETRGILRVTGKKEPRLNKVNLEWDEEEVASALKDKQLMSMILQDDSCLGKL